MYCTDRALSVARRCREAGVAESCAEVRPAAAPAAAAAQCPDRSVHAITSPRAQSRRPYWALRPVFQVPDRRRHRDRAVVCAPASQVRPASASAAPAAAAAHCPDRSVHAPASTVDQITRSYWALRPDCQCLTRRRHLPCLRDRTRTKNQQNKHVRHHRVRHAGYTK
jgi:hypothetical protein